MDTIVRFFEYSILRKSWCEQQPVEHQFCRIHFLQKSFLSSLEHKALLPKKNRSNSSSTRHFFLDEERKQIGRAHGSVENTASLGAQIKFWCHGPTPEPKDSKSLSKAAQVQDAGMTLNADEYQTAMCWKAYLSSQYSILLPVSGPALSLRLRLALHCFAMKKSPL